VAEEERPPGHDPVEEAAAVPSTSLYATTIVSAVTAAGTPGDDGIPSVASPDPAAARKPSACPW